MSFVKALLLLLTKPFWCSVQGLYQVWQLNRFKQREKAQHKQP